MKDLIVLFQMLDPIYKEEREPRCPRCRSTKVDVFVDRKHKTDKGKCNDCRWIDDIEKFN